MIKMDTSVSNNNLNIFPNSKNNKKIRGLHIGQRRFGENMASTSPAFQSQLLKMRHTTDDMKNIINSLRSFTLDAAKSIHSSRTASAEACQLQALRLRPFMRDILTRNEAIGGESQHFAATALATDAGFALGTNYLSIGHNEKQFKFTFNVSETDTLQEVQQRVADAINEWSGTVIFATVTQDTETGASVLAVETCWSVFDENSISGGIAIYSDNGISFFGAIDVERFKENSSRFGLPANFRHEDFDFINSFIDALIKELGLGGDINSQVEGIPPVHHELIKIRIMEEFVENFNGLMKAGDGWELGEDLSNLVESYSADLEAIGIFADEAGFLHIDEDVMKVAIEIGEFERFVFNGGKKGYSGFINRIERLIESVIQNPPGLLFETLV